MSESAPVPILFCITSLEPGGAERALVDLVTRLPTERFSPQVASLAPRPEPPLDLLFHRLEAHGIETRCFGARRAVDAPRVVGRLSRWMETQRPAIVHTFLFHATALGTIAARRAGIGHVVAGIRVAERRYNLHGWTMRWLGRSIDRYVCVSQAVADFAERRIRLPHDRVCVIPTGIDVAKFPAKPAVELAKWGIPAGAPVALYAGRFDRQKRVDRLLRSAPLFLDRLPNSHLLLVGRGRARRKLESAARRTGAGDRIHFLGWRDDVPRILAAVDLLVLPSAWEGLPRVVLEAMASAKPIVATDVEGVGELLGETADCQIVAGSDGRAFAQAVIRILSEPRLAEALGAENRRRVETHFSIDRSVAAYRQLYESLLAGP